MCDTGYPGRKLGNLEVMPNSPQELLEFVWNLLLDHGYLVIFAGASLDFGLPSSGDVVMLAGGWFSNTGALTLGLVMLVGASGALVSDNAMYWVGRLGGRPFVERVLRFRLVARFLPFERLDRAEKLFESHGGKMILVGRLLPGLRGTLPLSAGLTFMSYPRFLTFDVLAVSLWATLVSTVGFLFGEYWEELLAAIRASSRLLIVLIILVVLLYVYNRYRKRRRP